MLRFQRKLNFLEAISLQLAVTHACLMDGEHSLSLQRSIWFHWESSLTLILLRQLLIFLFFFFLLRKHRVLTLITNPVIWLFFSFCSMLVTLPIEILKMIWAQNTWSAQNIPFNLLPTFALVSLSYMYLGQRSKKGKGYLLISILIWRKGDWKAKLPGCHFVWEYAIYSMYVGCHNLQSLLFWTVGEIQCFWCTAWVWYPLVAVAHTEL